MTSTKQASDLALLALLVVGTFLLVLVGNERLADPSGATAAPDRSGEETIYYATPEIEALSSEVVADFAYPFDELLPNWRIEFVPGDGNIAGYTWSHEYRIEVFIRPNATADDVRRILAHELGHAVDVTLNTGDDRRAWQQARGIEDDPWWPDSGAADFQTGAGDFAEAFAYWVVGDDLDFRSELSAEPNAAELELIANLAAG